MFRANLNIDHLDAKEADEVYGGQDYYPLGDVRDKGVDVLHYIINVPGSRGYLVPLVNKQHGIPFPIPHGEGISFFFSRVHATL